MPLCFNSQALGALVAGQVFDLYPELISLEAGDRKLADAAQTVLSADVVFQALQKC